MKIITVSREFSSGGRELAKRLADALGFDYYDREIITEIAKNKSLDQGYVHSTLTSGFKAIPLHFARSFSFAYASTQKSELLVEEKRVIDQIAQKGRDFVIVGRNADLLLKDFAPLNIFVCADMQSKIQRCVDKGEGGTSVKEIEKMIKQIDKSRRESRALLSESKWGDFSNYHLVINSSGHQIKKLTPVALKMVELYFGTSR